ncbi:hypothetical protein KKD72_00235 [Patescibacteria group bacterium]|nr:hypothetical protein [Patescibacteria group bacterium]
MPEIHIIKKPTTRAELKKIAKERFGDLVKAAVDIKQEIMAVGGELHMDEEVALIEQEGSKQEDVWGINIYPEEKGERFIEIDSMINLKPALGNRSREIDNPDILNKVIEVVKKLII